MGHFIALLEDVDPEPSQPILGQGQIHFRFVLELLDLFSVHNAVGQFLSLAQPAKGCSQWAPWSPKLLNWGVRRW